MYILIVLNLLTGSSTPLFTSPMTYEVCQDKVDKLMARQYPNRKYYCEERTQ